MSEYQLLEILAIGFGLALLLGYIAQQLKLSPIVGYLVAGFLIGPHSPGFVADQSLAAQLSEAGVILLMFGVGLQFHVEDLMAVKGIAVPATLSKVLVIGAFGATVALTFGYTFAEGFILGIGLSVASTVVALRVLTENNLSNTIHERVTVGSLVVEDILTVIVLVLLPSLAGVLLGTEPLELFSFGKTIIVTILKLGALWFTVMVVGSKAVPWLLSKVVRTRSQELFTLTILMVAFLTAVVASKVFNASFALGAFLGGMVVGKSKVSYQAAADLLPLRDAFAVLFFISVGMLFEPSFLMEQPGFVAICLLIILLIKPLIMFFMVTFLGSSVRTALVSAISLGQVGEFSFILSQTAHQYELISKDIDEVLIICAMISISLNPLLFRFVLPIEKWLQQHQNLYAFFSRPSERRALAKRPESLPELDMENLEKNISAVIVGYGPTGQKAARTLVDKNIIPVVVEMNVDTVEGLGERGRNTIYGDSTKKSILIAAGIQTANYLVLTLPNISATAATATIARELNPDIRIFARARFLDDKDLLKQIGINVIAFEEEEVGITLAKRLLEDVEKSYLENQTNP